MTIANNAVAKLFVAFVAASMLFMLVAPSAKAATAEELQAQIAALMAQISALQGGSSSSAACTFTRALTVGAEGADVKCLQDYLTPTYFSNAGGSTGYFGPVTAGAVAAWQSANGVMPAVGYFGPVSQAKYNAMAASAPTTPTTGGNDDEPVASGDLSGEASLFNMEIDGASDDTIEEGAEDAELAVATVEFSDGDAMITRMDVSINTAIVGTDAWDVLDEVALFVDGDEIARVDASSKDDYLNEADGTLRFSGLDLVANEDEEVEITIAATLQGSIDTADQGAFTVSVDSMRFLDGSDVTTTEDGLGNQDFEVTEAFTIENAGTDDEIIVKTSTQDPDGTTFQLEDNARSNWENVFTFDLDTDDSVNDVELTTVVLTVAVTGTSTTYSTYNKFVNDAELVIDGTTISSVTIGGTATTAVLTFDVDGDVVINAGDRVAAELMLKFNALAAADEGATVQGSLTAAQAELIVAEGADDILAAKLSGSAEGDVHTLRTAGVDVSAGTISAVVTNGDAAGDDYATYKIALEVTAFNQDVYISTNHATSVAKAIEDAAGVAVGGTSTVVIESTGTETLGAFEITEGSTETITITVTFDATTANSAARLNLNTLTFAATAAAATDALTSNDQTWTASPDESYRTAVVTLVN
jgi:peptidoglycan hydrolase-like protein with peptidoglycan-binding domain